MKIAEKVRILFLPFERKKSFEKGIKIIDAAREIGINIKAGCSGAGKCGECRVIIKKTHGDEEKLACREEASEDLTVFIPEESIAKSIVVRKEINKKGKAGILKNQDAYGIAIDIGTTTIACYLANTQSSVIASKFSENPQINYGSDVMSRVTFSMKKDENKELLREILLKKIEESIEQVINSSGIAKAKIKKLSIVGNTAMRSIFLGYDLKPLSKSPFLLTENERKEVKAKAKNFGINLNAELYAMPAIESFIGSDTLACIIASGMHKSMRISMLIDIGTNGEIVIGNKERLLVTSCACGPAFEGMHIKHGMAATKGAIEKVKINARKGDIKLSIINAKKPLGICGSGIVSAISELFKARIIDKSGRFTEENSISLHENLEKRLRWSKGSEKEFVISFKEENGIKDIAVTQSDIRSVQLAKAAIASAWKILVEKYGIKKEEISKLFIAGAFGNYLDRRACINIGMLPDISLRKIKNIGNAAGNGAIITLFDNKKRDEAKKILNKIEHINLAKEKNFESIFVNSMFLDK